MLSGSRVVVRFLVLGAFGEVGAFGDVVFAGLAGLILVLASHIDVKLINENKRMTVIPKNFMFERKNLIKPYSKLER